MSINVEPTLFNRASGYGVLQAQLATALAAQTTAQTALATAVALGVNGAGMNAAVTAAATTLVALGQQITELNCNLSFTLDLISQSLNLANS